MSHVKRIEREHFRKFQTGFPALPAGAITHDDTPDFLIRTESGVLGIEHTRLFQPTPAGQPVLQEQESLRRRVTERVTELLRASDDVLRVQVFLTFSVGARLRKSDIARVAGEIFHIVKDRAPKAHRRVRTTQFDMVGPKPPEPVEEIDMMGLPAPGRPHCGMADAAFTPGPGISVIQQVLDRKASRIAACRRRCQELWLLMVAGGEMLAGTIDSSEIPSDHPFRSDFDRVFVMDDWGNVTELQVR